MLLFAIQRRRARLSQEDHEAGWGQTVVTAPDLVPVAVLPAG